MRDERELNAKTEESEDCAELLERTHSKQVNSGLPAIRGSGMGSISSLSSPFTTFHEVKSSIYGGISP